MISPHTPPGTPLVVVWCPTDASECYSVVVPSRRADMAERYGNSPTIKQAFAVGDRFVLVEIRPHDWSLCGFVCRVSGLDGLYSLKHFDVAALPSCLTDLLASKPVDQLVEEDA